MKKLIVNGMTCGHCEKSVKEALLKLDGVTNVSVNLKTKEVLVEGKDLADEIYKDTIDSIGFEVSSIE